MGEAGLVDLLVEYWHMAIVAALLHNVGTFAGLGNAGRLLLFDETQPTAAL